MLLLFTAFIWGTAFVAQKNVTTQIGPLFFVGGRFLLTTLALLPFVFWERKKHSMRLHLKDCATASIIGVCLFTGASLQQLGLITTTATNAGFLTALYVVFVPFTVWALRHGSPRLVVLLACVISILGAWLLSTHGQSQTWSKGDMLVLLSDIVWAIAITLIPVFLKSTHRPFLLSFIQSLITAVLGIMLGLIYEPVSWHAIQVCMPAFLYTGFISGAIGFTLQIIAQKYTPAAEAALIMSLESVFAAITAAILLQERLTLPALIGCGLILLGVVIVEIGPILRRRKL